MGGTFSLTYDNTIGKYHLMQEKFSFTIKILSAADCLRSRMISLKKENFKQTQIWNNSKEVDLTESFTESFIFRLSEPKGILKTSYLPQQIYVHSDTQINGSDIDDDNSNKDPITDEKLVTPILYGHHMIDLEGSKGLKFKGCCWDGAEYNLDKYDIHLRPVLKLHQGW